MALFNLSELKKEGFKVGNLLGTDPQLREKLMAHISRTVRHDELAKNMVFLTGISAYTKSPINLFMRGPSSIGKSYNTIEVLKYFPQEDVWMLGGLSPTALVHDFGMLVDENGEPIDFTEKPSSKKPRKGKQESSEDYEARLGEWQEAQKKWRKKMENARYVIDLHQKILVFLEPPHIETYNKLRPILSHDKEEISFKFTDKTPGGLRTLHVVLSGWPATIFCSTKETYVEDLATRGFTITPEMGARKYEAGVKLIGEKRAHPRKFKEDYDFMLLKGYFGFLRKHLKGLNVAVPIAEELAEYYPHIYARSMRDFDHFTALLEISALFVFAQRPVEVVKRERQILGGKEGETVEDEEIMVLATMEDLEYIAGLWKYAEETTVTGLPGHILDFYHKAVEPLAKEMEAFTYKELTQKYNEVSENKKSSWAIRKWVKLLTDVGYLDTEPSPQDKRMILVKVIKKVENACNSWIPRFLESFTLEKLEKWLDYEKQILETERVFLKDRISSERTSLLSLYKTCYVSKISLEQSKAVEEAKEEKKAEITSFQESQRIPRSLTIQETLVLLRAKWQKGYEQDFDKLVMETKGCTREEAEKLREKWIAEGIISIDPDGWLVWT